MCSAALSGHVAAQTFRAAVDVVRLDVSVLDKHREPVRGLRASDFTVLEDGQPRPVVAFSAVELPAAPAPGTPWMRDAGTDVATNAVPEEGRLVVIVIDRSVRFEDLPLARAVARQAIEQLGPGDLASLVFTSEYGNAGIPQNFTADRARLLAAVDRPIAAVESDADPTRRGGCYCNLCVMEAITRIADTVRDVPGRRKVMLFISSSFKGWDGGVPTGPTSTPFAPCAFSLRMAREKLTRAAGLANLTIHTLNPMGLTTGGAGPVGHLLADLTGGRAIASTNAPEAVVPAIFHESASYYLIGFQPADPSDTGTHRLEVKVDRDEVLVRARTGYDSSSTRATTNGPARDEARVPAAAIDGVLPATGIPLRITAVPFAASRGGKNAIVAIAIGARVDASSTAPVRLNVLTAAFDPHGAGVGRPEHQTIAVRSRRSQRGPVDCEVLSRLALPPGHYEIRAGVDAPALGTRGTVFTFVDVPDFSNTPLSVSGPTIAIEPPRGSTPTETFADILPVIPSSRRRLTQADAATLFLRIHEGGRDKASAVHVRTRIVDALGATVVTHDELLPASTFQPTREADSQMDLPVRRLTVGDYLVRTDVSTDGALATVDARISVGEEN
jgi:VWFA-related protein